MERFQPSEKFFSSSKEKAPKISFETEDQRENFAIKKASEQISISRQKLLEDPIIKLNYDYEAQQIEERLAKKYEQEHEIGILLEYTVNQLCNLAHWFGKEYTLAPTIKYDDYYNHIDAFLYQPQLSDIDVDKFLGLSFDCTISEKGGEFSKKVGGVAKKFDRILFGEKDYNQEEIGLVSGKGFSLKFTPKGEQFNIPAIIIGAHIKDTKKIAYNLLELEDTIENKTDPESGRAFFAPKARKLENIVFDETYFSIQAYIHFLDNLLITKKGALAEITEYQPQTPTEEKIKEEETIQINTVIADAENFVKNLDSIFIFLQEIIIKKANSNSDHQKALSRIKKYFILPANQIPSSSAYDRKNLTPLDIKNILKTTPVDFYEQAVNDLLETKNQENPNSDINYTESDLSSNDIHAQMNMIQRQQISSTQTANYQFASNFTENRNNAHHDLIYKLVMTKLHQIANYEYYHESKLPISL